MTQTYMLTNDEITTRCLPGAARLLAISAAYLSIPPDAISRKARNGYVPGTNRSVPMSAAETTGARL